MGLGDQFIQIAQQSYAKDAILTTDYTANYITKGNGFQIHKRVTISGNQTLYITLDATATAASGMYLYSLPVVIAPNQGNIFVDTYNVPSYTGGTVFATPINLNELSPIASLSVAKIGITTSGTITNLREYSIGAPLTNQSSGGGAPPIGIAKILDNRKPIIVKIMNQETATVILDFNFAWFEIPPYVPIGG